MKWNNKELANLGDVVDAMKTLKTKEEAQEFLSLYREENENASENIGYLLGYLSNEEAGRLYKLLGTKHPFFGEMPFKGTSQDAFNMGVEVARNRGKQKG